MPLPNPGSRPQSGLAEEDELLMKPAATGEIAVNLEDKIDLAALADEVYALLKKELKLEKQRRGRNL